MVVKPNLRSNRRNPHNRTLPVEKCKNVDVLACFRFNIVYRVNFFLVKFRWGVGVPVDSAPENDNVAWAPSDQSRDFNVDRPLPQIQTPATDGRLAGGHSQISQGQLRNTGMNSETGRFTNIDFSKGLFALGNHATCQLGSGTYTQSLYIEGLSMGNQKQSGRPAPVFSIFNNVGSHVPKAILENVWAGSYVDLDIVLKSHAT